MKKFLITTVVGIATTAAFGAASLRAPQIGGTATVAAPTATTNTARAGTMRTQTMKTSSVSTPSVTTTQSIATPVSTETTDARIALLKGIKGFNPGKIKDTTAATNELNAIDSRIEELQSKLDQAEAAADQTAKLTDVYTKEQVEAKIDEKISAIGTSTSAKETYSKAEVDALLQNIVKKLPQIDERGNMTWTDPNGNLVTHSIYYINLVNEADHLLISFVQDQGMVSQPIAHIFTYHTNKTDTAIQQYVSTTVCSGETSKWCGIVSINSINNGEAKEVKVMRLIHGGDLIASTPEYYGYTSSEYWTFEDSPKEYVRNKICGDRPENECNVNEFYTRIWDAMGEIYNPGQFQDLAIVRIYKLTRYYMDLVEQSNMRDNLLDPGTYIGTMSRYNTNMSDEEIDEYLSSTICNDETSGSGWCERSIVSNYSQYGVPRRQFMVYRLYHGYQHGSYRYITSNNTEIRNFLTAENDAEGYILSEVCGTRPSSECHLATGYQTTCRAQDTNLNKNVCSVYIERSPEPGTGWYLPAIKDDD